MSVVGYSTPGKDKARLLLDSFCLPVGGSVVDNAPARLLPGAAAFYGVTPATKHLWVQARQERRDWYYIDNAYFDSVRQVYFRITRNRLQHSGSGNSTGERFAALKIEMLPWRQLGAGEHVLICPQSDEFMRICAEHPGSWLERTLRILRKTTQRELRVRPWNRNKEKWYASLPNDLKDCHALVTYSSASAISALLHGVPAFCTAEDCIAAHYTSRWLDQIESPKDKAERLPLMQVAADNQFTVSEMRSGYAWRAVNGL